MDRVISLFTSEREYEYRSLCIFYIKLGFKWAAEKTKEFFRKLAFPPSTRWKTRSQFGRIGVVSLLCQMGVIFTRGIVFLESWAATIKVTCDLAVATVNVNHDSSVRLSLFFLSSFLQRLEIWEKCHYFEEVVKLSLTLRQNGRTKIHPPSHFKRRNTFYAVFENYPKIF